MPQRRTQIAAEFGDEVDRDAGVHTALAVEELGLIIERHNRAVPDVGVQVERTAPVAPEGTNFSGVTSSPGNASGTTKLCPLSGWKSCQPSGG